MSALMRWCLAVLAGLLVSEAIFAADVDIDIKGLRIGMAKEEVEAKFGRLPIRGFTIAGVIGKYDSQGLDLSFRDNQLDSMMFMFAADRFDEVMEAVKSKYPAIQCTSSPLQNRLGAVFEDTQCLLTDALGTLRLRRFVSLDTSLIGIISHRKTQEIAERLKAKKGDI